MSKNSAKKFTQKDFHVQNDMSCDFCLFCVVLITQGFRYLKWPNFRHFCMGTGDSLTSRGRIHPYCWNIVGEEASAETQLSTLADVPESPWLGFADVFFGKRWKKWSKNMDPPKMVVRLRVSYPEVQRKKITQNTNPEWVCFFLTKVPRLAWCWNRHVMSLVTNPINMTKYERWFQRKTPPRMMKLHKYIYIYMVAPPDIYIYIIYYIILLW